MISVNMPVCVTCTVPLLVVVENEVLELVTVPVVVLVVTPVSEPVVKAENVLRLVEVLVDRNCVYVEVNVPLGEPVVVTVVDTVPVTTGLKVKLTETAGAVTVDLVDEVEVATRVLVRLTVWVDETVVVVVGSCVTTT